jgi:hypothetical protein
MNFDDFINSLSDEQKQKLMQGLSCISNELKEQGHKFQTMTWKRFNQLLVSDGEAHALNELGKRWLMEAAEKPPVKIKARDLPSRKSRDQEQQENEKK